MKYTIQGNDFQFVEIILEPNESIKAEPASMIYMDDGIEMETKFFDKEDGGFFSKLGHTLKRAISGENLAISYFTNVTNSEKKIAFSAELPGQIIPIEINGNEFLLQQGAYLCSTPHIDIDIEMTRVKTGFFGGEGFILQKVSGEGVVFANACGGIKKIELNNETIKVDTGGLVGFSKGIDYDIEFVKGFKNIFFSGEGLTLAKLSGTGVVYVQSMPFRRFVNKIYNAIASKITKPEGERSLDIFDSE